ncbi:hypothetical protein CCR75_009082 [Bremia lactucae]|uniref:Putative zinc-finger domain-containing protein n=1 Tax=Bremia lactucae TaxID=4779 RepID=A0A976IKR2_BRELC|nr:hypothetical protein CCR75_009082 [Bremia lactucae]
MGLQELGIAASAGEEPVVLEGFEMAKTVAKQICKVKELRQSWVKKREASLKRKETLLKLLKLQDLKRTNIEHIEPQKTETETNFLSKEKELAIDIALARKEELKDLQARAEAARRKQQAAATLLSSCLKKLLVKRKREDKEANDRARKKSDVGNRTIQTAAAIASTMHPFAAASELDVGTTELATAACFRIATRHLVQTGKMILREELEQAFKTYTSLQLKNCVEWSTVQSLLATLANGDIFTTKSESTRNAGVCWQPGRQFLTTPTFISSDASQIQTMVELEKEVVASACDPDNSGLMSATLIKRRRQGLFLKHLLDDCSTIPTLSSVLCACIGVHSLTRQASNNLRISYRSHAQMVDALQVAEIWLREQAEKIGHRSDLPPPFNKHNGPQDKFDRHISSRYAKPFSVLNDSITKQLKRDAKKPFGSEKNDLMKVLCRYELNGVCNDKNCSNYHLKDYDLFVSTSADARDTIADSAEASRVDVNINELKQLMDSFAAFRERIKWPVITTTRTHSTTANLYNSGKLITTEIPLSSVTEIKVLSSQNTNEEAKIDGSDFIPLDCQEELFDFEHARYIDNANSRKMYGEMLQAKVKENSGATDAWLLLAIHQLELVEGGLSDDFINSSNDDLLQQQLVILCKELNCTTTRLSVDDANLKRCLHTLSRALEIEANAYCEALWLLYLHLCEQVMDRQTEIDMVEQAVQFLPNSHALWLRYVSTFNYDSVGMVEGIHRRLLEHLAQTALAANGSKNSKSTLKKVSILLAAIYLHLCIKLWYAGATSRVLELLTALLQLGNESLEPTWSSMVRSRLRCDELIVLCLVLAHVLLFNELPSLIEHWVAASNCECIPIKDFIYTADILKNSSQGIKKAVGSQTLASYKLAFHFFQSGCDAMHDSGNVIFNNWMLLLALQGDDKNNESLNAFFVEHLVTIQRFPGASLTAAKLMGLTSTEAQQLMITMINQSSSTHFPKALHNYLFACRLQPALVIHLDEMFPDVMERLASLVDINIDQVQKSVKDIMHDSCQISKSRALKSLLDNLLGAWMDQLALMWREAANHQFADRVTTSKADIYVALDICHLMGVLLEISVAIDGIQLLLGSSSFNAISYEAKQLAWMQRFILQVDLLQKETLQGLLWREYQARVSKLFRKYMTEMSVESEMMRQVTRKIKTGIFNNAVEDAVCDCLNPEGNELLTYGANLEIFRLCSAAIAGPDKAAFHASCTDLFTFSSAFSLSFSAVRISCLDAATHEWELLAARASLRKCLFGAKSQRSQILQALVAVDLRLKNMKAISSLLESEIQLNPLLLEPWRLAVALEILFGKRSDDRSKIIANEIEKRQVVYTCNTFGDDQIPNIEETSHLKLRGLCLDFIPNAVLLQNKLVSLDISGNELLELPKGLRYLTNLKQLDASENALFEFPTGINRLVKLEELRLAHNNLISISVPVLPRLNKIDVCWNAATNLSSSDIATLPKLDKSAKKIVSADELSIRSDLLSSRKKILDAKARMTERDTMLYEDKQSGQLAKQIIRMSSLGESSPAVTPEFETRSASSEMPIATGNELITAADIDAGQSTEQECVPTVSSCKEFDGGEVMIVSTMNAVLTSEKVDNHQPTGNGSCDIALASNLETDSDQITTKKSDAPFPLSSNPSAQESAKTSASDKNSKVYDSEDESFAMESLEARPMSFSGNLRTIDIAQMDAFVQNYSQVVKSTAVRRQMSQNNASVGQRRLDSYMKEFNIDNRVEVRNRNPTLWREFLAATLPANVDLPACKLCFAPNDGPNQRLNSVVLCMSCLKEALLVLKERNVVSDAAEEIA